MTPREMLAPQPPPDSCALSESVTDWLLGRLEVGLATGAYPPDLGRVAELLRLRREQGLERYGTELTTRNGRNPTVDALQEALDLLVYLTQAHIEAPGGDSLLEVGVALEHVTRLSGRLERS